MMKLLRLVRPHPLWLVPALVWMAGIWRLSARPASAYRRVGPLEAKRLPVGQIAIGAHLGAFGTLGALLALGLPLRGRVTRSVVAWSAATIYGVIDERHQARVPGRDASTADVVTDAGGALVGVASIWAIQRWNDCGRCARACRMLSHWQLLTEAVR